MTREQILAMKPGREMDELVAERLLGWVRGDTRRGEMPWYEPEHIHERHGGRLSVFHYSTDPGLWAVALVPAMAKRGWDFAAHYWAQSERYTAYFLRDSRHEGAYAQAEAGALSEAVSKAALLALLKEGDAT